MRDWLSLGTLSLSRCFCLPLSLWASHTQLIYPSSPFRGQEEGTISLSAFWLANFLPASSQNTHRRASPPTSPPQPSPLHLPSPYPHSHAGRFKAIVEASVGWEGAKPNTREDKESSEHSPSAGCQLSVSASVGSSGQRCDSSPFFELFSHHQRSPGKQSDEN